MTTVLVLGLVVLSLTAVWFLTRDVRDRGATVLLAIFFGPLLMAVGVALVCIAGILIAVAIGWGPA